MPLPPRIQRRRTRGWRKPPGAVYVGRPSRWGNPFVVGQDGTAAACVAQFRARYEHDAAYRAAVRRELAGKGLACYCRLDAPCHAEVLLEWANPGPRAAPGADGGGGCETWGR